MALKRTGAQRPITVSSAEMAEKAAPCSFHPTAFDMAALMHGIGVRVGSGLGLGLDLNAWGDDGPETREWRHQKDDPYRVSRD